MRLRLLPSLAALAFLAAPVFAEPPKPTVVVQAKPVSRILADFREVVRQVAGPDQAEKALKGFDRDLKEALGEQGFEGLDTNRPLAGYVVLREDPKDITAVVVVPVTGEKEFLDLLKRLKFQTEPVKDKKGVYKVEFPDPDIGDAIEKDSHVQIAHGHWAYLTVNDGNPTDVKDLIAPGTLLDNSDQSLLSVRLYPERVPEKLLKKVLDDMDNGINMAKGFFAGGGPPHVNKMITTFFDEGPKLVRRYAETGRKEAEEIALRLGFDAAASSVTAELTVTPRAGTGLAKDIAANAVVTSRFANFIPKDAAVGVIGKAPLFAKEIREIVVAALAAAQEELKSDRDGFPKQFHPIVDEVAKSLIGSVKKGELEAAVALVGPAKNGKFTLVGGLSLDDAVAVEKALRQVAKGPDFAKVVEFDNAKAGAVSIHKVAFLQMFPERARPDFEKLFGAEPAGYAAFEKDAVFLALGPDALALIKAAIEAKPGPAPLLDAVANAKRLHAMVLATGGERDGADFAKFMGTDDKTLNIVRVTVEGGQKLTVRGALNLRFLPRAVASGGATEVRPVPPPVIK